ncbi:glycosyltransferase family 4 protein [Chloroflexota bacterium]
MRIGVYIGGESPRGGAFQYALTLIASLNMMEKSNDEYVIFKASKKLELPGNIIGSSAVINLPEDNALSKVLGRFTETSKYLINRYNLTLKVNLPRKYKLKYNKKLRDFFVKNKIELMIYPSTEVVSFESTVPYIIAIHDVQHRRHPEFPEVGSQEERNFREYVFTNAADNALSILVDSDVGKEDIINEYHVEAEKIKVLPFVADPMYSAEIPPEKKDSVKKQYGLPDEYLFYPAQFFPHKNHINIIKALDLLKREHNLEIPAVFIGPKKEKWGEFDKVFKLVSDLELDRQVLYSGYVETEDIPVLYSMAKALVMPTFFGPTNIPPLEAFAVGCPVVASNIRGMREQIGDAGLLFDPDNPAELANAVYDIWTDNELRTQLIERGYQKTKEWIIEDFSRELGSIIDECKRYLQEKQVK